MDAARFRLDAHNLAVDTGELYDGEHELQTPNWAGFKAFWVLSAEMACVFLSVPRQTPMRFGWPPRKSLEMRHA